MWWGAWCGLKSLPCRLNKSIYYKHYLIGRGRERVSLCVVICKTDRSMDQYPIEIQLMSSECKKRFIDALCSNMRIGRDSSK